MRSIYIYSFLALAFASAGGAQIVLDPVPARVAGHPVVNPPEALTVTNLNPNLATSGGMYSPAGVAFDNSTGAPILYVSDTGNNRILAWKNATSSTLSAQKAPDLIIGQPNAASTLPAINGGLHFPSGLVTDSKGNLYVADSGNNRILRYPAPFSNSSLTPDMVIGQPDKFTSSRGNQGGTLSAITICLYVGCPLGNGPFLSSLTFDSAGNLFVVDAGNSRVLRFPAASLTSGAVDPAADLVVGQPGFTVANRPASIYDKNTFYIPAGIAFDSAGHLFVTDGYSRLLVFPSTVSSPTGGNGIAAIRFAGIVNPTPSTSTASTLYSPDGVVMINNSPAVLDAGENRLLFFDSYGSTDWNTTDPNLANPPPVALAVLGQGTSLSNFTSSAANEGNAQPSASTFSDPVAAVVGVGGDLFVVDSGNNRVLVFTNGGGTATASAVLGQPGFVYDSPNSIHGGEFYFGIGTGNFDAGIAVDSSSGTPHLYVSDPGNNRVLGFADARKFAPGVIADIVIGQPDLMTAVCNYHGVTNPPSEALPRQPTASSLCYPTGLTVDPSSGDLFVADSENGRVLRFPAPFTNPQAQEAADLVLGQTAFTGISNPQASQSVMVAPYGVYFDPQRGLLVSDTAANRVLIFPMSNPTNGEPATAVIGQPGFTSTGNSVLNAPHHVAEDSIGQVYVADSGHNQITVFTVPSGSSTDQPTNSFTGLYYPQAIWVNQNNIAGYHDDVWVGDSGIGISRFPPPNPLVSGNTPSLTMPAVEVAGPSVTCASSVCAYPAIAITQDANGALYVADASNRISVHYPALAAENSASSVCAMGCQLGGLAEPTSFLAPGSFGSLYLFNGLTFASTTTTNYSLPVPSTLGGLQVIVNGVASPITNVLPSQLNFVVPFEAPTSGTVPVQVVNASTQQVIGSGTMSMNVSTPGFFTTNSAGTGQIAALNCNKTPCENTLNGTKNPVNPGKYIQFFLTGQGISGLSGAIPKDGELPSGTVTTATPVVYVGGTQVSVQFSGMAPCCVGMWQINVQIPGTFGLGGFGNFPQGVFPVLVDYNGQPSNTPSRNSNPNLAATIAISAPE